MIDEQNNQKFVSRLEQICTTDANKTAIVYMRNDGSKTLFTFGEMFKRIQAIREQLYNIGLQKGDRVAIIAPQSPFAIMSGLSLAYSNIASVLIDASLPSEEINRLLEISDVRAIFTVFDIYNKFDKSLITDVPVINITTIIDNLTFFNDSVLKVQKDKTVDPHLDVLAILYSSGTTASMKGVMITYESILHLLPIWKTWSLYNETTKYLIVFPLNHIAGFTIVLETLLNACEMGLIENFEASKLSKGLLEYEPTHFGMVPRVFEMIEEKIRQGIHEKGRVVKIIISSLMEISGFLRKKFGINIGKKLLKSVTKQAFGSNIYALAVGSAPCKASTADFYLKLGLEWGNTYATTETGVPISGTSTFDRYPIGTEGHVKFFDGIDIKIHEPDENGIGEIRVKTILIMKGYFREPELTATAFDEEGYFKTGDLGCIDKKGYLHVTGRAKETILLHTGKKVAPFDLDNLYGELCPNVTLASCGVPFRDGNFDEIHLFIENGGLSADSQQEIKNIIMNFSFKTSTLYKIADVHFIKKLPITSIGKIKRYRLKEIALSERENLIINTIESTNKIENKDVESVIFNAIKEILVNHNTNTEITLESRLKEDLGLDSLDMMTLGVDIESSLNVTIIDKLHLAFTVQNFLDITNNGQENKDSEHAYNINDYPMKKTDMDIKKLKKYAKWSKRFWKFNVNGAENIPTDSNYILCPNHQSHFDSLWIWTAIGIDRIDISKICCLAKQEHLENKTSRFGLTVLGGIPVDRSGNTALAMKRALECIKDENYNILIHPEGTRTLDGKIHEFKGGAAKLAIDANVPIIPVRIDGARDIFPPQAKRPKILRFGRRYPIKISFGKPIKPDSKNIEELTAQIQGEVEKLGDTK